MSSTSPEQQKPSGVPLRFSFGLAAILAVAIGGAISASLIFGKGVEFAADDAWAELAETTESSAAALDARFSPIAAEAMRARNWLLNGALDPRKPASAHQLMEGLLQSWPELQAVTLLAEGVAAYRIERGGAGWYVAREGTGTGTAGVRETVYNAGGPAETKLSAGVRAERLVPGNDPLVQRALEACDARPDANRGGRASLAWEVAALPKQDTWAVACALAARDDAKRAFAVRFECSVDIANALARRTPFAGEYLALAYADGAILAMRVAEFQRVKLETPPAASDVAASVLRANVCGDANADKQHAKYAPLVYFTHEGEGVWRLCKRYEPLGGPRLWIAAAIPEGEVLRPRRDTAMLVLPGVVAGLLCALLAAWFVPRPLLRTIRVFVAKAERIEREGIAPSYWPRTRVREFRALQHAMQRVPLGAERESVANADTIIAEEPPVHIEPPAEYQAPAPAELIEVRGEVTAHTPQELEQPPHAYVQALQSTRRQLRELQAELEGVYLELQDAGARDQALRQRLERQRGALSALGDGIAIASPEHADAFADLAAAASAALGLTRVRVWLHDPNGQRLECAMVFAHGERSAAPGAGLLRTACPVFFLAVESEAVLSVRDAAHDARVRDFAAALNEMPPVRAMLAVPVRRGGELAALFTFEDTASERLWEADEQNFAMGLVGLVTYRFAAAALPAPVAAPQLTAPRDEAPRQPVVEESLFRAVVQSASGMVWTTDLDGCFSYVNPAACAAYGWRAEEMLGRYVTEFAAAGCAQLERLGLRAVRDGQPHYSYLTEHLRADGTPMTLAINLAPLRDPEGRIIGTVALAADTSHAQQRKPREADPDATFRALVTGSHELIFELDAIGVIRTLNPAVERVYGYAADELIGKPITVLCGGEQASRDLDRFAALLGGQECAAHETVHSRKDGSPVRLLVVAEVQRDPEGRICGAIGAGVELPA